MTPISMTCCDRICKDQLEEAKLRGVDVSYSDEDRSVEAYELHGKIYFGKVEALPGRE